MSNLTDWMGKCHELEAEIERLENLLATGIHTCGTDCKRPICVQRHRAEKAEADSAFWQEENVKSCGYGATIAAENEQLKAWNQERAGQFAVTEQRLASRVAVLENRFRWLHWGNSTDPEGYEWGIYRVKWENGVAVSVMNTFSDLSDLDAEIAREEKEKP